MSGCYAETAGAWRTPFPPLDSWTLCAWMPSRFICVWLQTLWTAPCQAPMSMKFCCFLYFIVKLRGYAKADGAKDVYCPDCKKLRFLVICLATLVKQLWSYNCILYILIYLDECIPLAARSLIINFIFIIKVFFIKVGILLHFYFMLLVLLICLVNQYSKISLKEKTLKNEVNNFHIIIL